VRPLVTEILPIEATRENTCNPRTHSGRQISQLAASIRNFGFLVPLIVDKDGMILAGHGRLAAARSIGLSEVPVVRISHLTPEAKRAYVIADNRLAELAGWDNEILRTELAELSALDLGFDVEITGFDTVDIDRLTAGPETKVSADPADDIPSAETSHPTVSQPGSLWKLGRHRVLCGNALENRDYACLLEGERAQLVFTDAPFNVPIQGHVVGKGRRKHREFSMASGEMSRREFTDFLHKAFANMAGHCSDGAIVFSCIDWRHIGEMLTAAEPVFGDPKNLCVWVKSNGGMGTFYRSRHELVFVFKNGTGPHINNFGLGERGRYRTNVWNYFGVNSFGRGRDEALEMHPTVKPVALVADAIKDCSKRGGVILDPFGGSGTTLIAAERTGRSARLIEIDPFYCDVIVRRWQKLSNKSATDSKTGRSFDELAALRGTDAGSLARVKS